jgi:exosortase A
MSAEASGHRGMQLAALAALLAMLAFAYYETLQSIGAKWFTDMTYSHGGLVLPISVWLLWRCRHAVAAVPWTPSGWGVAALLAASLAWLVARAAGVLVGQQLAVVAMISAVVLAVLGPQAYRRIAFPLAFLVFAVPFGRALVPGLMQVTADITVTALNWTGVPVFRQGMMLSIPGGDFEVARACSGLNYLMTGVVLGTLFAYLTYSDWRKQITFVAATVAVLIVANGVRAYLTVAIAHWSDMRYGTGYDHIVFGRVLFLAVVLVVFWVGQRWRDSARTPAAPPDAILRRAPPRRRATGIAAACILLIVGTPWYLAVAKARADAKRAPVESSLAMPAGHGSWQGPRDVAGSWRPPYSGALLERATTYVDASGSSVDLYVGVYELGGTGDGEMISYRNRLYPQEHRSLLAERAVSPSTGGGEPLRAREFVLPGTSGDRLIWYWFMIGEDITPSRNVAKVLEAVALISGQAGYGRIVTLATHANDIEAARRRLASFATQFGSCARGGFAPQLCAG